MFSPVLSLNNNSIETNPTSARYSVASGSNPREKAESLSIPPSTENSRIVEFAQLDPKIKKIFRHLINKNEEEQIKGYKLPNGNIILTLSGKVASKVYFPVGLKKFLRMINPFSRKDLKQAESLVKPEISRGKYKKLVDSIKNDKTYIQVKLALNKKDNEPKLVDITMTDSPHTFKKGVNRLYEKDVSEVIKLTESEIKSLITDENELKPFTDFFEAYRNRDKESLVTIFDELDHTFPLMRFNRNLELISPDEMLGYTADAILNSQQGNNSDVIFLGLGTESESSNQETTIEEATVPLPNGDTKEGEAITFVSKGERKESLFKIYFATLMFALWGQDEVKIPKDKIDSVAKAVIKNVSKLQEKISD